MHPPRQHPSLTVMVQLGDEFQQSRPSSDRRRVSTLPSGCIQWAQAPLAAVTCAETRATEPKLSGKSVHTHARVCGQGRLGACAPLASVIGLIMPR
jgi:hypothetical protein